MNTPKHIINIGTRFGSLIVLRKVKQKGSKNSYYICLCDCSKETKPIMRGNLISGNIKSCGCIRASRASKLNSKGPKDLKGLTFGWLVVLKRGENTSKGQARWWCRCRCGKTKLIEGSSLRTGNSTSCGCKRSHTIKSKPSSADDLTGRIFGKLVVLGRGPNDKKKVQWWCLCECGKTTLKKSDSLKRGKVKSCGCLELANRLNNCSKRKIKHGLYKHPLYFKLHSMIARCYSINAKDYHRYGGRGIKICKEWLESPKEFIDWAIESGWTKGADQSIDRIDNDGNYCPTNCRIIQCTENTVKRFTDRRQGLVIAENPINIREQCRRAKISPATVKRLLKAGYSQACIIGYGKLKHFQKIAVSKSITENQAISINAAQTIRRKHKIRKRPLGYNSFIAMKGRCYNKRNKAYPKYGGRGIQVCKQWRNNFEQFILDMGPPPHPDWAIHRVNNDGDYEPSNCRWESRSENTRAMHKK